MSTSAISRATNRAKRQVMARVAPVNRLVNNAHRTRIRAHQPHLPVLDPVDAALVSTMESDGVSVTSLQALDLPGSAGLRASLETLVSQLAARDPGVESALRPTPGELLADIEVWRWGLNQRLLDIVENYIGLPVRYYGAAMYREVADGKALGTRQWHRDIEDHRVFKILVWLNDVGPRGGAFQYIPKPMSQDAVQRLKYVAGYVPDDAISAVVPTANWIKATGPQWTAVMADPAAVLHRASTPEDRDRYSVTFTWTSRSPIKTMPAAEPFSPADIFRVRAGLSARQIGCLPAEFQQ
jgi:hypothetical protein